MLSDRGSNKKGGTAIVLGEPTPPIGDQPPVGQDHRLFGADTKMQMRKFERWDLRRANLSLRSSRLHLCQESQMLPPGCDGSRESAGSHVGPFEANPRLGHSDPQ